MSIARKIVILTGLCSLFVLVVGPDKLLSVELLDPGGLSISAWSEDPDSITWSVKRLGLLEPLVAGLEPSVELDDNCGVLLSATLLSVLSETLCGVSYVGALPASTYVELDVFLSYRSMALGFLNKEVLVVCCYTPLHGDPKVGAGHDLLHPRKALGGLPNDIALQVWSAALGRHLLGDVECVSHRRPVLANVQLGLRVVVDSKHPCLMRPVVITVELIEILG